MNMKKNFFQGNGALMVFGYIFLSFQCLSQDIIPDDKWGKDIVVISVDTSSREMPADLSIYDLKTPVIATLGGESGSGHTKRFGLVKTRKVVCDNAGDRAKKIQNVFEVYSDPEPIGSKVELCYRVEYVQNQAGKKVIVLRLIYKKTHDQTWSPRGLFLLVIWSICSIIYSGFANFL